MNVLFICHRIPYPPNKGEKIRAFHIIEYLSKKHKIYLYSLCDSRADLAHAKKLKRYCSLVRLYPISRFLSPPRAAAFLFTGYPLSLAYFFSFRMKRDIKKILANESIDIIFASCSSSAQYALDIKTKMKVIDFIDADSDKWRNFAKFSKFPLSLIYRLESNRIREWEKRISEIYDVSMVTTEKEREKLEIINPNRKEKIHIINNGIDFDYFMPQGKQSSGRALIFTGQMDYLPNVDAVLYFYKKILPLIRKEIPDVVFHIVGRNPSIAIKRLCRDAIITGYVKDIRDYLGKASVYVAPLRVCHGVQNKILEAMASGLPVVATSEVLQGIDAVPGKELMTGDTPDEFAEGVVELLKNKNKRNFISANARAFVEKNHDWRKNLSQLDKIINVNCY